MGVTLIKLGDSEPSIESVVFYGGETVTISLADITEWDTIIVLVSGLTQYTTEPANFRLELIPEE